jgi:hypothetical protein
MLVRALIPDPAAIRTGRAMSMRRSDSRSPPATGVRSASGTVMPGAGAACASADQAAAPDSHQVVTRSDVGLRTNWDNILRARVEYRARSEKGPLPEIRRYSITSSARTSSEGGTSNPRPFAAFRLTVVTYLVGTCTGSSAGFAPRRIRSR